MRLSDIEFAKRLKFKLKTDNSKKQFVNGCLVYIAPTSKNTEFFISPYGGESQFSTTDFDTANYIKDTLLNDSQNIYKCLFSVEGTSENHVEVQTYTFNSVTEYKTGIEIQIQNKALGKGTDELEHLEKMFIWNGLGKPAIFVLNYKNAKKNRAKIRIMSKSHFLYAENTNRGLIATGRSQIKNPSELPIDVYLAPTIKFVDESTSISINNELSGDLETIRDAQTYFARWEAYNELTKKYIEDDKKSFGSVDYTNVIQRITEQGIISEFDVMDEIDPGYLGSEVAASSSWNDEQIRVGEIKKIDGGKIETFLQEEEGMPHIADIGTLSLYTKGDEAITKRRDAAKNRMINRESPIKFIVSMIENGVSQVEVSTLWGNHQAITRELERNFKRAKDLNPDQQEALSIAINTPDIAIIQGPPGTGKTTVIKAICERFREIFESEQRQHQKYDETYIIQSPRILISSFQNEAVDNAVSAPIPGDMPAKRVSRRSSIKDQYSKSLDKWYDGVRDALEMDINSEAVKYFTAEKVKLADAFLSYRNAGEPISKAIELFKEYLQLPGITFPVELELEAKSFVREYKRLKNNETVVVDPIEDILKSQRLTRKSFDDDGRVNSLRLLAHLNSRNDIVLDSNEEDIIKKIGFSTKVDDASFETYILVINKLKDKYCAKEFNTDLNDKERINGLIMDLYDYYIRHFQDSLADIDSQKSLVLSEFLNRLKMEYEYLVDKYSYTTAATCQTCLNLRDDLAPIFDLVIIDEAARANPLDLFIPMSMGKKIILVGDHKQLPHMLEHDIVETLAGDDRFSDLPDMEISLFERMFNMFSAGNNVKAKRLNYQYRMHPDICNFVSNEFYDENFKPDPEKINKETRKSPASINKGKALTFVNVQKKKGQEVGKTSKSRPIEAKEIAKDIKYIMEEDPNSNVGVISFYSAQNEELKNKIGEVLNDEQKSKVEIGTVDAFQGKEFDYVMLSCVRANDIRSEQGDTEEEIKEKLKRSVGFLMKTNRLCVAFSRARKQLITYGDGDTLSQVECFEHLITLCKANDERGGFYREC